MTKYDYALLKKELIEIGYKNTSFKDESLTQMSSTFVDDRTVELFFDMGGTISKIMIDSKSYELKDALSKLNLN